MQVRLLHQGLTQGDGAWEIIINRFLSEKNVADDCELSFNNSLATVIAHWFRPPTLIRGIGGSNSGHTYLNFRINVRFRKLNITCLTVLKENIARKPACHEVPQSVWSLSTRLISKGGRCPIVGYKKGLTQNFINIIVHRWNSAQVYERQLEGCDPRVRKTSYGCCGEKNLPKRQQVLGSRAFGGCVTIVPIKLHTQPDVLTAYRFFLWIDFFYII